MDQNAIKLLNEVHAWLQDQSKLRLAEFSANPTPENLSKLKEIKARYKFELRNINRILE
jgi:hypothetical protein